MWPRALLTVALRGPGKVLLLASAFGWIATAWFLSGNQLRHFAMSHQASHFTPMWLAMILAMAPPLLLREVVRLWRTSLRRMRHLTIAWFLCGYVGVWLLTGVAISALIEWVTVNSDRIAVAVALVIVWHCSPGRQRCLNACHRVPALRVFGSGAQSDSLRYGISTGCYCIAACSLLMFLVLLVKDHHLAAMAVMTAVSTVERHLPARRPEWRLLVLRGRAPVWPEMAVATRSAGAGWR
jgi:predicted metal-binding membrane protein